MSRGAEWSKWDLHIHTPASLVQQYGADNEETWDRYLGDLEALPSEFTVIGINDYWFLDGYRKVLNAKLAGRLSNIDCILPVIELRVDQFGGSESKLSRANLHVIFDPSIRLEVIEAQFVNALSPAFKVLPGRANEGQWSGVVTRESLADLGRLIKSSVPSARLGAYDSDVMEGFNNLVVPLESVYGILDNSYFHGRCLTALGKVEWADIKWRDGSIASKKNLVNQADLLFTAYDDVSKWKKNCTDLASDKVINKVLDCSDAHTFSGNISDNNRVGRCATWIRAESRFNGLVHALSEFDDRVFVGTEPPDIGRRRTHPETIINSIKVRPVAGVNVNPLFDYQLDLNHGLVAIVGNKGQGKSALLDCVARASNSSRDSDFGFLNSTRFLSSKNKSKDQYEATVEWVSGRSRKQNLAHPHNLSDVEYVEYLPQMLIERICASDPLSEEQEAFQKELRKVLFNHIPVAEREQQFTLEELVELRAASVDAMIKEARSGLLDDCTVWSELHRVNSATRLDELRSQQASLIESIGTAEFELQVAREELQHATGANASGEPSPLRVSREEIANLEGQINQALAENDEHIRVLGEVRRRLSILNELDSEIKLATDRATDLDARLRAAFPEIGDLTSVITLVVDSEAIAHVRAVLQSRRDSIVKESTEKDFLISELRVKRNETREWLEVEDSAREARRRTVEQLEQRVRNLRGSKDVEGTLEYLNSQIQRYEELPELLENAKRKILARIHSVHKLLLSRRDRIADLYRPAAEFIATEPLAREVGVEFSSELAINSSWHELVEQLDGRKNSELISNLSLKFDTLDISVADEVIEFIDDTLERLCHERGEVQQQGRDPHSALKTHVSLVDLAWQLSRLEWIDTTFALTGNGEPLEALSPGQRGLILLLFYLIVDQSQTPLLLDQPEENLDNKAVRQILVPALKRAKARRQIIIVTHNANLAIVGDADQIVLCSYKDDRFVLHAGAISEFETGENALDVLEGTRPAFLVRQDKYNKVIPRPSQT